MDAFLSYMVGFFDGEGSIGIYTNGKAQGRTLRVQLTQTITPDSTELLRECRSRWGGSLALMNRTAKRPAWNWQVSSAKGVCVLNDIRPWLRLKATEADLALAFWDERTFARRDARGRFLPLSPEVRMRGDDAQAALKAAKRRAYSEFIRQLQNEATIPVDQEATQLTFENEWL